MAKKPKPPSVIPGRKGGLSVADAAIKALWIQGHSNIPPQKSLGDLTLVCAQILGFDVGASTIRSTLYRHPEIFEKAAQSNRHAYYRLSQAFVEKNHEE